MNKPNMTWRKTCGRKAKMQRKCYDCELVKKVSGNIFYTASLLWSREVQEKWSLRRNTTNKGEEMHEEYSHSNTSGNIFE